MQMCSALVVEHQPTSIVLAKIEKIDAQRLPLLKVMQQLHSRIKALRVITTKDRNVEVRFPRWLSYYCGKAVLE